MCYTLSMSETQPIWFDWARTLQHWGINQGVASLLEGFGSLSILLAQLLYLSQPLLAGAVNSDSVQALAQVLENPLERRQFASILRGTHP